MSCAKSSRSLSRCRADDFADLDAPLGFLGHVVVGKLTCDDDVTVAQLDHVAVGVDVGDEQALVSLDAAGDVVQVGADVEALDLPLDRTALCLHLHLDPSARLGALGDLDRVEIQVGRRPGEALHGDAADGDLLDQFLVVSIECVEAVDLGVLDLVGSRVTQHHEGVELGQRVQGFVGANLLRLVDDDDRPVRLDNVDGLAGLEVVQDVIDTPLVLAGRVERLDVDDHHLHPGVRAEPLQLVELRRVVDERSGLGAVCLLKVLRGYVE